MASTIPTAIWNGLSYGGMLGAGDISQQLVVWKTKQMALAEQERRPLLQHMDWSSSIKCFSVGTAIFGPIFYYWYR